MESILNTTVSCWKDYFTPSDPLPVSLLTWVTSDRYWYKIEAIRAEPDKKIRDQIKATLPAITPGGTFTTRCEAGLVTPSGFLQFDLDQSSNPAVSDWEAVKMRLASIDNIAFCGLSASGRGVWGLIPISHPTLFKEHFLALNLYFLRMELKLDKAPSSHASLRGYSWDPAPVINHNAKIFTQTYEPPPASFHPDPTKNPNQRGQDIEGTISKMVQRASDGEKHGQLLKAAKLAGGLGIDDERAVRIMIGALNGKDVKSLAGAEKTIRDGLRYGKQKPIISNH